MTGLFSSFFTSSLLLYDLANALKICFVDYLARWLIATQNSYYPIPALMDFEEFSEGRVFEYIEDVIVQGHQYKHVIASRLELAIGIKDH